MKNKHLLYGLLSILNFLVRGLRKTTSYVPIANALGVFSGGANLANALGEVQIIDHSEGKPFRSSLVVGVRTGIPGHGYFEMARRWHTIPATPVAEFQFWLDQMKKLGAELSPEAVETSESLGITL